MTNQNPLSQAQLDSTLLKMASKQLHIDPQRIKTTIGARRPQFQISARTLGNDTGNQLNSLLSDPQKMQQILSPDKPPATTSKPQINFIY